MKKEKIFSVSKIKPQLRRVIEDYAEQNGIDECARKWVEYLAEPLPLTYLSRPIVLHKYMHKGLNSYYDSIGLNEDALKWAAYKLGLRQEQPFLLFPFELVINKSREKRLIKDLNNRTSIK